MFNNPSADRTVHVGPPEVPARCVNIPVLPPSAEFGQFVWSTHFGPVHMYWPKEMTRDDFELMKQAIHIQLNLIERGIARYEPAIAEAPHAK